MPNLIVLKKLKHQIKRICYSHYKQAFIKHICYTREALRKSNKSEKERKKEKESKKEKRNIAKK
jgi:hypothetical protein